MVPKQLGFIHYAQSSATTRIKQDRFISDLEAVLPWRQLLDLIKQHYPNTSCKDGRPSYTLETFLRIIC